MNRSFFLLLVLMQIFCIISHAQSKIDIDFHMGIDTKADILRSSEIKNQNLYWNYGLKNQLTVNNKLIIELNAHHSIRSYEEIEEGLITNTDIINGTTSYYSSLVEEKFIELENQIKYQILNERIQPFIGIGYSVQLKYTLKGERKIVHSDGTIENLSDPDELISKSTYGINSSTGINVALFERLNVQLELGHKWYFNSNLNIYGFPKKNEHPNRHKSIVIGLSIMYKLI